MSETNAPLDPQRSGSGAPEAGGPRFRLRLAGLAILWERIWPALWPVTALSGLFLVLALADFFRRLPGWLHAALRSEEHTSELQSHSDLVCRLLLEKKKNARGDEPPVIRLGPEPDHPPDLSRDMHADVQSHDAQRCDDCDAERHVCHHRADGCGD